MIATPIYDQCLREWKADHQGRGPGENVTLAMAVGNVTTAFGKIGEAFGAKPAKKAAPRKQAPRTTTKRTRR